MYRKATGKRMVTGNIMDSNSLNNDDIQKQDDTFDCAKDSEIECVAMQNPGSDIQIKQKKWLYEIEERRREVAYMLAQGHSETEIAQILHVHVSTICRDVKGYP